MAVVGYVKGGKKGLWPVGMFLYAMLLFISFYFFTDNVLYIYHHHNNTSPQPLQTNEPGLTIDNGNSRSTTTTYHPNYEMDGSTTGGYDK